MGRALSWRTPRLLAGGCSLSGSRCFDNRRLNSWCFRGRSVGAVVSISFGRAGFCRARFDFALLGCRGIAGFLLLALIIGFLLRSALRTWGHDRRSLDDGTGDLDAAACCHLLALDHCISEDTAHEIS